MLVIVINCEKSELLVSRMNELAALVGNLGFRVVSVPTL